MSDLTQELLQGARPELTASFSLAMEKAREKLEKFQLPDPRFYILQLVQAIVASGATRLEVGHEVERDLENLTGRYRLTLSFNGPGYTRDELSRVYDFLFESGRDRARDRTRELSLGLVSAQALNPERMTIICGEVRWERAAGQADQVLTVPQPGPHNLFELRGRGSGDEVKLLESHCSQCAIEIRVNGRLVSSPGKSLVSACPWPNYRFTKGSIKGALGLAYGDLHETSLTLLRYGVQFSRRWEPRIQPAVVVVCEDAGLRKNASQSDVVEDQTYLGFVEQLQTVMLDFALSLSKQRIPGYHREVVQNFLIQFFGDWLSQPMLFGDAEQLPTEMRQLMGAPLFPDIKGRMRSLREIADRYRTEGYVALSKRRLPYLRASDLLVLAPSNTERLVLERLFDNCVFVDDKLQHLLSSYSSQAPRIYPDKVPGRLLARRSLDDRYGDLQGEVGIPESYPAGECAYFVSAAESGPWQYHPFEFNGWSAEVRLHNFRGQYQELEMTARAILEHVAPDLYKHLLERLLKANRKPEFMATIFRAREHLLTFWNWQLQATTVRFTEDPKRHLAWCREALGEAAWTARIFDTRGGQPASLADMEVWLDTFDTLTLAVGGPRFQDDHALEASANTVDFLSRIFGPARLQQATLRSNLLHQRQQQAQLVGAADAGPLIKPAEANEEEELARLKQEFEAAAQVEVTPIAVAASTEPAPEGGADSTAPDSPPETAGPAGSLTAATGSAGDLTVAVDSAAEPGLQADEDASATAEGSLRERVWKGFVERTKLVFHAFNTAGLSGTLAITGPDEGDPMVYVFRGEEPLGYFPLFGLPVHGWLDLDVQIPEGPLVELKTDAHWPAIMLSEEQDLALRGHCHYLFEQMSLMMGTLNPAQEEFRFLRAHLLQYLAWDRERTRERLQAAGEDAITRLRFVPAVGHTLVALANLAQVRAHLNCLEVVGLDDPDPGCEYPVPVLDDIFTAEWLEALFGCPVKRAQPRRPTSPQDLLLVGVRKALRQLRTRGDLVLSENFVNSLYWGAKGNYFVFHDPSSGATFLNPQHGVVKKVLKQVGRKPALVTMLASSIYTAINRALEEVNDEHELAFLEALLETHAPLT